MGALLDELRIVNPDYVTITELAELSSDDFEMREYQRPAGYAATYDSGSRGADARADA